MYFKFTMLCDGTTKLFDYQKSLHVGLEYCHITHGLIMYSHKGKEFLKFRQIWAHTAL